MEMGGASMDPAVREGLARSWKALLASGSSRSSSGCVAILVPAVASVGTAIFIGWILLIAGGFLVAGAFTAHSIGTVILRLLWAFLTVIVGIYLIVEPHGGTLTLTLRPRLLLPLHGVTRVTVAFLAAGQQGAGLVGSAASPASWSASSSSPSSPAPPTGQSASW
jgi:uncharacterized membrane protein HdeD (DUF308 family)